MCREGRIEFHHHRDNDLLKLESYAGIRIIRPQEFLERDLEG